MHNDNVILKYSFEVGLLNYGYVENSIHNYCFKRGYNYHLKKGSGILSKLFFVEIIVPRIKKDIVKEEFKHIF